ncbi:MAG: hypothetical protein AVDCRST_MAG48-2890, partial [uncultured Friedmanniella sp.]
APAAGHQRRGGGHLPRARPDRQRHQRRALRAELGPGRRARAPPRRAAQARPGHRAVAGHLAVPPPARRGQRPQGPAAVGAGDGQPGRGVAAQPPAGGHPEPERRHPHRRRARGDLGQQQGPLLEGAERDLHVRQAALRRRARGGRGDPRGGGRGVEGARPRHPAALRLPPRLRRRPAEGAHPLRRQGRGVADGAGADEARHRRRLGGAHPVHAVLPPRPRAADVHRAAPAAGRGPAVALRGGLGHGGPDRRLDLHRERPATPDADVAADDRLHRPGHRQQPRDQRALGPALDLRADGRAGRHHPAAARGRDGASGVHPHADVRHDGRHDLSAPL